MTSVLGKLNESDTDEEKIVPVLEAELRMEPLVDLGLCCVSESESL